MANKGQSKRLTKQHEESHGVLGIFNDRAKAHDSEVYRCQAEATLKLQKNIHI